MHESQGFNIYPSSAGLIIQSPFSAECLMNFGPLPQYSPTSDETLFKAALQYIKTKSLGTDINIRRSCDGSAQSFILLENIDGEYIYREMNKVGDLYDIYLYPYDQSWVACLSASDLILVIGMDKADAEYIVDLCGGKEIYMNHLLPALSDVSFSEKFWASQNEPYLQY